MSNPLPHTPPRAAIIWLAIVLAMIAAIVLVGGLTRLTDSGLSITEWKPVTGIVPPLSDEAWLEELEKYRSTTEYQLQNRGMSLADFKTIYWWEWGHRLLARTIGLVVLFPLLWFWWRRALPASDLRRGAILFGLICVQGLIGWLMVVSGLVGRLDVSQYRLAAHLGVAFVIFGWTLWMLLDLGRGRQARPQGRGHGLALATLLAVFIQVIFGALVAGLDAGLTFNTWPLMDGAFVPGGLLIDRPWWSNFGENVTMVQFQHRMMAYLVLALAFTTVIVARGGRGAPSAWALAGTGLAQAGLGIATLLAGADGIQPIALGAMHQLGALALVAAAIVHLHALGGQRIAPVRASARIATTPG